jgi:hypothetical protein
MTRVQAIDRLCPLRGKALEQERFGAGRPFSCLPEASATLRWQLKARL